MKTSITLFAGLLSLSAAAEAAFTRLHLKRTYPKNKASESWPPSASSNQKVFGGLAQPPTDPDWSSFTTHIGLGMPRQVFEVQISTGTSNFWVPSVHCSTPTCSLHPRFDASISSTFQLNGTDFKIPLLTSGVFQDDNFYDHDHDDQQADFVKGHLGRDTLMMGSGIIEISNQSFGLVLEEQAKIGGGMKRVLGNDQFDGILGFGYHPEGRLTGQSVLLNLVDQGYMNEPVFGIYFSKTGHNNDDEDDFKGNQLTLGGLDPALYSDEGIEWHEVTRKAQGQWAIELTAFTLRREAFEIDGNALIDSGYPYIALTRYQAEMINAQIGAQETAPASGFYELPCKNIPRLSDFIAMFGQESYVLNGNEYVRNREEKQERLSSPSPWSRYERKARIERKGAVCQSMIVGMDFPKETGIVAIFGEVFLQKYFSAYDLGKGLVGFALAT